MPELPEVEFAARHLKKWLTGQVIERVEAEPSRIIRPLKPTAVEKALAGRKLLGLERRAKYMLLTFDGDVGAMSHLGMTGKWVRRKEGEPEKYSKLRLHLANGNVVHYADPRLFGAFTIVPAKELRAIPAVAALGPDPLADGLDAERLGERLGKTSRPVKIALMDQTLLAGLGNIHAAEALYRAKIHPSKKANALTPVELKRLEKAIHATIEFALRRQQDAPDGEIEYIEQGGPNPFLVYDRKGEKCKKCKSPIASFTQGGRTTYYCPGCQVL